jgi:hypothetical protein
MTILFSLFSFIFMVLSYLLGPAILLLAALVFLGVFIGFETLYKELTFWRKRRE